jgi:hypothetical protein
MRASFCELAGQLGALRFEGGVTCRGAVTLERRFARRCFQPRAHLG